MGVMELSMFAEEFILNDRINSQNCIIIVLRVSPDNWWIPSKNSCDAESFTVTYVYS